MKRWKIIKGREREKDLVRIGVKQSCHYSEEEEEEAVAGTRRSLMKKKKKHDTGSVKRTRTDAAHTHASQCGDSLRHDRGVCSRRSRHKA